MDKLFMAMRSRSGSMTQSGMRGQEKKNEQDGFAWGLQPEHHIQSASWLNGEGVRPTKS